MASPARLLIGLEAPATVAALMASGRIAALGEAGPGLVRRGADPRLLREAAYVAALFCGFPAGVAALAALASLPGRPHRRRPLAARARLRARGERIFHLVHRENAARQIEMLETLHPDFADSVLVEAYGAVFARPFLPLAAREIAGVAALAVLGLERQLRAHLLAARHAGVSPAELRAAIRLAARLSGRDLGQALALAAARRSPRARR